MSPSLSLLHDLIAGVHNDGTVRASIPHPTITRPLIDCMLDFPQAPKDFYLKVLEPEKFENVVLCSGGMDSAVMLELTKDMNRLVLFLDYGQPYAKKEWEACQKLCPSAKHLKIEQLNFEGWDHIVPLRNFALLLHGAEYCQTEGNIWLGAVDGESSHSKGDKSELFFALTTRYIHAMTGARVNIKTLKAKTKNDWLHWYLTTTDRTDILDTVTCYDSSEPGCGKCQACVRKWIALQYCGIDPQKYFLVNPYYGGLKFIENYKQVLQKCLEDLNFEHYSRNRCEQDLAVIHQYEEQIKND